jgi:hypothetical protein
MEGKVMAFVKAYGPAAAANWRAGGSPPLYKLASAGIESGWGAKAPGFNFFGAKAGASWDGPRQLLATWEAAPTEARARDLAGRVAARGGQVLKALPPGADGNPFAASYALRVKDWFAAYPDAAASFRHHDRILKADRYAAAWQHREDSTAFARAVAAGGYATDPHYNDKLQAGITLVRQAAGQPAAPARLAYGPNADSSALRPWAARVVAEALERSGNPSATVTSTRRTPESQARAMAANLAARGAADARRLYGPAGEMVVDAWEAAKARGLSPAQVEAGMAAAIRRIGPEKVSRHMGDFTRLAVLDVAPSSLARPAAFIAALKADPRVSRLLSPPDDPAIHIEIPRPPGASWLATMEAADAAALAYTAALSMAGIYFFFLRKPRRK